MSRPRGGPWRKWYNTAKWADLKQEAHTRDLYTCQMCGRICGGKYPAPDSPTADHKEPHRGSEALFFDINNIQTLCKSPCHDKVKQADEQASVNERGIWY
ncbi:HNH endonuclease [Asticcacaulis excentricus]|uniref:HNH endonuclease n=1 Tax=Asticcacaulis excentricus (strain ATCC 15261 / DSM 4724 / KCTC 12464 / NCIMB 9791 / VKM B-1370 / CB 48) TaxID=573065 RepID=E8RPP7_ASTEC|nr:HNH endonuclease [Asticcacaulis excentricus]ADU12024.1 HNH endonuclease [Asticcacaulis excentricus CB 48]